MSSSSPPAAPPAAPAAIKRKCGPHVELAATPAARITRCPCGVVHLHLAAQSLTVRLTDEQLRHLGNAASAAARLIDLEASSVDVPSREGPLN